MWRPTVIGKVLAQRRLTFRGRKRVSVLIGEPVRSNDKRDPWWCPVQIKGALRDFQAIAGEDSLQALVLALRYVQNTLPSLARESGGEIDWLGEHERLIFAETDMIMMQWTMLQNLTDGVAAAVSQLEAQTRPPVKLLTRLRRLVASQGASPRR